MGLAGMRSGIMALACSGLLLVGCAGGNGNDTNNDTGDTSDTGIDPTAEDEIAFQAALALYEAGSYTEALAAFEAFLGDYPDSPRADNAAFLIGRCQFELLDYATAWQTFVDFLADHPTSSFVDDALYYRGRAEYEQALFATAAATFEALVTTQPSSKYVDNANYYGGRSLYEAGDLTGALVRFDRVVADAGSSYRDGSLYWAGRTALAKFEASAVAADATAADGYFETLFADYPGGVYEDNGRFHYGMVDYRRGDDVGARTRWNVLRTNHPTSPYLDETSYYYGLTWYHEAAWSSAAGEFDAFIASTSAEFTSSIYRDNVLYFAGRSHFQMAPAAGTPATEYAVASDRFSTLLTDFPTSTYVDNALYFRGRARYARAGLGVNPSTEYAGALSDFGTVITDYTSSRYRDDSWLYKVRVEVDLPDCIAAAATLAAFDQAYGSSWPQVVEADAYYNASCP